MHLVCYAYSQASLPNLRRQVARLVRHLPISSITVVYRQGAVKPESLTGLADTSSGPALSTLPYNGLRWEFGAYQLGLDNIESRDSGVLIANDTFGRNYPFFADELRRFSALVLQARHSALATAVGSVEDKGCEFSLCNIGFRAWVRSNLFYLNGPAIQALDGRVFEPEIFQAPTASQGRLRINLPASPGFADYITAWMAPTPSKHNWLGHTGRSEAPDQVLRDKTGSILLEKRMSSRLLAAGGALLRCNLPESAWHRLRLRVYLRLRRLRGS